MLIDNKDALTAVDDCNYKIMSGYEWIRKQEIKKRLKELPSAERVGKWEVLGGMVICSECGEPNRETDYCPHCGARMKGKEE